MYIFRNRKDLYQVEEFYLVQYGTMQGFGLLLRVDTG